MKTFDFLDKKCVSCLSFKNSNEINFGYCVGNIAAYKEMTGKTFRRGAPEGPSFKVRKLDGCSYYSKAF